jgi:hypothetical protein
MCENQAEGMRESLPHRAGSASPLPARVSFSLARATANGR